MKVNMSVFLKGKKKQTDTESFIEEQGGSKGTGHSPRKLEQTPELIRDNLNPLCPREGPTIDVNLIRPLGHVAKMSIRAISEFDYDGLIRKEEELSESGTVNSDENVCALHQLELLPK